MPEPAASAASAAAVATIAAASAALPALNAAPHVAPTIVFLGYSLGVRADVLLAGFAGSLAALAFFDTVPSSGDTWRELLRTTMRRLMVMLASSLTSGYITPLLMLADGTQLRIPESLMLSVGFVAGAGAQHILARLIRREEGKAAKLAGRLVTEEKVNDSP